MDGEMVLRKEGLGRNRKELEEKGRYRKESPGKVRKAPTSGEAGAEGSINGIRLLLPATLGSASQFGKCKSIDAIQFPEVIIFDGELCASSTSYELHVLHDGE